MHLQFLYVISYCRRLSYSGVWQVTVIGVGVLLLTVVYYQLVLHFSDFLMGV
jgi:hypothetical protein